MKKSKNNNIILVIGFLNLVSVDAKERSKNFDLKRHFFIFSNPTFNDFVHVKSDIHHSGLAEHIMGKVWIRFDFLFIDFYISCTGVLLKNSKD